VTRKWRLTSAAALMLAVSAPAFSAVMGAEEFYQRAMKLKKKGPLAVFSGSEIKRLVKEVKFAGETVKRTRLAAEASGKHGRYCPPESKKPMETDEYLRGLGQIPAADRAKIDLIEATTRILEKKFPCRNG
jgi:hypothetical protein